jgi:hypothetical protein
VFILSLSFEEAKYFSINNPGSTIVRIPNTDKFKVLDANRNIISKVSDNHKNNILLQNSRVDYLKNKLDEYKDRLLGYKTKLPKIQADFQKTVNEYEDLKIKSANQQIRNKFLKKIIVLYEKQGSPLSLAECELVSEHRARVQIKEKLLAKKKDEELKAERHEEQCSCKGLNQNCFKCDGRGCFFSDGYGTPVS